MEDSLRQSKTAHAVDPTFSAWEKITALTPPQELDEIRRTIGVRIVDEVDDLRREVTLLSQISEEYRAGTEESVVAREEEGDPLRRAMETTFGRETLRRQIALLLSSSGSISGKFVPSDEEEKRCIEYVARCERRDTVGAVSSSSSRSSPTRACSRGGARSEGVDWSSIERIDLDTIDICVEQLRGALNEEKRLLLLTVEDLRRSLERDRDLRSQLNEDSSMSPPSTTALRKVLAKLRTLQSNACHKDRVESFFRSPAEKSPAKRRSGSVVTVKRVDGGGVASLQAQPPPPPSLSPVRHFRRPKSKIITGEVLIQASSSSSSSSSHRHQKPTPPPDDQQRMRRTAPVRASMARLSRNIDHMTTASIATEVASDGR